MSALPRPKKVLKQAQKRAKKVVRTTADAGKNVRKKTVEVVQHSWDWVHQLGASFWFLLLFLFIFAGFFFFDLSSYVTEVIITHGLVAIFMLSFFLDFLVQPIGPDIPLVTGILLGIPFVEVYLVVLLGSMCALVGTYFIGKYVGEPGIQRILGVKRWNRLQKKSSYGKWALFLGALTPVPFIPYLAGLYKLSLRDTVVYVVIPRSIRFLIVASATYWLGNLLQTVYVFL